MFIIVQFNIFRSFELLELLDKDNFILNLQILGLMRTLTGASKHGSKMYSRMTLKDILVVNQWVGVYGSGDEEYFEYIPGIFRFCEYRLTPF